MRHSISRPAKPVRASSVLKEKKATQSEALEFLNDFVREARREIRKRESLTMCGSLSKTDCDAVSFVFDSFCLTIDFKIGIRL